MKEATLLQQSKPQTFYPKAFLSLGELIIADKPTHIWTVLGSCVSVILYNPRKKVSALCHAQMAESRVFGILGKVSGKRTYTEKAVEHDFRFVGSSISYMLDQMLALGISRNEIYASVFGGANLIANFSHKIGKENIDAAIYELERNGVRIVKKDVGGIKSRIIRHFSDTGVTKVRTL
jgi:Chemotaxis protein; stimulates methylation of MCP proteins